MASATETLFGNHFGTKPLQIIEQAVFGVASREAEYLANINLSTQVPSVSALINAWYRGGFDNYTNPRRVLTYFGIHHGADFGQSSRASVINEKRRGLWNSILEISKPHYPLPFLRQWYRRALSTEDDRAQAILIRLQDALRNEGFPTDSDKLLYVSEPEDVALGQLIEWLRLGIVPDEDAFVRLASVHGYTRTDLRSYALGRYAPPSAGAIVAAGGAQAWDARFARRWGLSEGQTDQYRLWAQRAGLTLPAGLGNYGQSLTTQYPDPNSRDGSFTEVDPTWGDLLWRTHWRLPSLGQLAEWVHRFRGDPAIGSSWSVPTVKPLSDDELAQLMTANGVPAEMHEQTYNLMFRPLTLRDVRMLVRGGESDAVKVTGWLLDNGYSPDNAGLMARRIIAEETNRGARLDAAEYAAAIKRAIKDTIEAYSIGLLSQADTLEKLQDAGLAEITAQAMVGAADLAGKNKLAQSVMRRARQDLFSGRTNPAGALSRLIAAGVQSDKAGDTVRGWTLEYGEGRRYVATERVLRYLRKGFITKEVALQRLQNMGWANGDILLLLAEVQSDINADTAKAIHASETRQLKEEQAIQKQLESTARNANRLIARLKELTPPRTLIQWYVDGVWSEAKVRQRFSLMGYPSDIVDSMLLDALEKKKPRAKPASEAKK